MFKALAGHATWKETSGAGSWQEPRSARGERARQRIGEERSLFSFYYREFWQTDLWARMLMYWSNTTQCRVYIVGTGTDKSKAIEGADIHCFFGGFFWARHVSQNHTMLNSLRSCFLYSKHNISFFCVTCKFQQSWCWWESMQKMRIKLRIQVLAHLNEVNCNH